jgi:glycosyltransferase involved in cell wall biosynthesis
MPRVTVLVPATRPDFLGQTIASVLAQTEQDFQVVVADDSRAGDLTEALGRFSDPRLRYIRVTGRSQPSTIAALWEQADSPYVHVLHDDDFLLPFCLATLLEALEGEPTAAFALGNSYIVSGTGARLGQVEPVAAGKSGRASGAAVLPRLLGRCSNFLHGVQCVTIRRNLIPGHHAFTSYAGFPLRTLLDVAFYVNALQHGPMIGVGEFLAAYRKHERQASTASFNPEHASLLYEWELILRGELSAGRLEPRWVASAVEVLTGLYRASLGLYPELQALMDGLPDLQSRVESGDTAVLDADYERTWRLADRAVQARVDAKAGRSGS